ncbi:ABC transporter permease [Streptococcus oricebi]|uniref:ABC transporter permease n=2 Tax=Streptococcus oricebi TaxID=1547447 RepID=A0ABS5B3S6_9STRE|nr:ABC transporter permease [Streptococcus oricebi]
MLAYIKSENLKYLYNKWILLTILSTLFCVPILALSLNPFHGEVTFDIIATKVLQSFYLGQVGFIVTSILYIGQEFSRSTLRTSLLSVPNRLSIFLTKIFILFSWYILVLLTLTLFSILTVTYAYQFEFNNYLLDLFSLLVPVYFSIFTLSLIVASVTFISQSIVLTLGISLSLLLGLGQMLLQFSNFFKYSPILAAMNLFYIKPLSHYLDMSWGLFVQGGWAIVTLITAYYFWANRSVR